MSFDAKRLAALLADRPLARVVVASTQGSVPRNVGASMLVDAAGLVDGTIGGGALELQAISAAQAALATGEDRLDKQPLGPGLGQCCGGAVTLLTEVWTGERLAESASHLVARPVPGGPDSPSLSVQRILAHGRDGRTPLQPRMLDGWMIEPVSAPDRIIWVWGAGHVGRAIVDVLAPLPGLGISWIDSDAARFPTDIPSGVTPLVASNPADLVSLAPPSAEHYVLTYSHAFDLEICHRVLSGAFLFLGLIGSETKRARFRSRLSALGHENAQIDRLTCPIGDPALGKHPQEIALGVGAEILRRGDTGASMTEIRA